MTLVVRSYLTNTNTEQIYTASNTASALSMITNLDTQISPAVLAPNFQNMTSAEDPALSPNTSLIGNWRTSDVNTYPYSFVTYLTFDGKLRDPNGNWVDGTSNGTGFLIGPHVMLTAAHNLYDTQHNEYSTNIKVNIRQTTSSHVRQCSVVSAFFDKRFFDNAGDDDQFLYDWALVFLSENVFSYSGGYFGIGTTQGSLNGTAVTIAAYKGAPTAQSYASGQITTTNDRTIIHNIFTYDGNSGAPIYGSNDTNYIVWGIHTFKEEEWFGDGIPGGTRFTSLMYQFFCEQIDFSRDFFGFND